MCLVTLEIIPKTIWNCIIAFFRSAFFFRKHVTHLIDHIIFYNFYLLLKKVYQLIKFNTQPHVFIAFEFIFIHIYCLSKKPQKASDGWLQAIWSHLFTASSFFPHFSRRPGFSWSRFFRVLVFLGPGFSGSRFFRVQIFPGPGFSGSWFFRVLVFQG